jgi:nitroreductase
MTFRDLVAVSRSYRRFEQGHVVERQALVELVELARLCPSSSNRQPLRYLLVNTPEQNARVFATLAWAGYLADWPGPAPGERPSAYVVILGDKLTAPHFEFDAGIAAQTMLLGAAERGLGGCMVASVDRGVLRRDFRIPEQFDIPLVIALGKPAETVVLEEMNSPQGYEYYRDAEGRHHVPKRPVGELIVDF